MISLLGGVMAWQRISFEADSREAEALFRQFATNRGDSVLLATPMGKFHAVRFLRELKRNLEPTNYARLVNDDSIPKYFEVTLREDYVEFRVRATVSEDLKRVSPAEPLRLAVFMAERYPRGWTAVQLGYVVDSKKMSDAEARDHIVFWEGPVGFPPNEPWRRFFPYLP